MLTIHLFAGLRDLAKTATLQVQWEPGMTVASLRQMLTVQYPAMAALLERSNTAINDQLATGDAAIPSHAMIAFLPPVSGG